MSKTLDDCEIRLIELLREGLHVRPWA